MNLLYTSDLHGNTRLYHELLSLAVSSSPEIILIGGDFLPSFSPTKRYEDIIPHQKKFIEDFLHPLFKKIFETSSVRKIFLIPGNWDLGYPLLFRKPSERIIDLNQNAYRLNNGFELRGYPFVPPTPFRPKEYEKRDDRDALFPPQKSPSYIRSAGPKDSLIPIDPYLYLNKCGTIEEDLALLPPLLFPEKTIYMMHSPPYGTRLDLIHGNRSAGSRSIKSFIEKYQPCLTLHGHIHESPELSGYFLERIGKTFSINPGQCSSSAEAPCLLQAVTFEMEKPEETLTHTLFGKL